MRQMVFAYVLIQGWTIDSLLLHQYDNNISHNKVVSSTTVAQHEP